MDVILNQLIEEFQLPLQNPVLIFSLILFIILLARSEERRVGLEFVTLYSSAQAKYGIRDGHVTGVQTCALPICRNNFFILEMAFLIPSLFYLNLPFPSN